MINVYLYLGKYFYRTKIPRPTQGETIKIRDKFFRINNIILHENSPILEVYFPIKYLQEYYDNNEKRVIKDGWRISK